MQLHNTAQQLWTPLCMRESTAASDTSTSQTFNEAQVTIVPAKSFFSSAKRQAEGACLHNLAMASPFAQTKECIGSHCNKRFCCPALSRPGVFLLLFSLNIWVLAET